MDICKIVEGNLGRDVYAYVKKWDFATIYGYVYLIYRGYFSLSRGGVICSVNLCNTRPVPKGQIPPGKPDREVALLS